MEWSLYAVHQFLALQMLVPVTLSIVAHIQAAVAIDGCSINRESLLLGSCSAYRAIGVVSTCINRQSSIRYLYSIMPASLSKI
jgi:hypothetical protein